MIAQLVQISKNIPLKSYDSTKSWSIDYFHHTKGKSPIEAAIIGGFMSQQFDFAFMAGYQAALDFMFPTIAPNKIKALCVSEAKGGHPKAIETTLVNNQVKGLKTYITAGTEVEEILILCKTNEVINGRPLLKMVHLSATTDNMELTNFELKFMKAIKHGKLKLDNVKIEDSQILEGDGFAKYTRPFRTLEDICIHTALHGMLLRQAIDSNWSAALRDKLVLNIFTLKNLIDLPLNAPETILLASTYQQQFSALLPAIEEAVKAHSPTEFQVNWALNRRFLMMGEKLKAMRLEKARKGLFEYN